MFLPWFPHAPCWFYVIYVVLLVRNCESCHRDVLVKPILDCILFAPQAGDKRGGLGTPITAWHSSLSMARRHD
ncbi:hypothetical protein BD414DRAFT_489801 [Trametes punicea]|nr:hypothetical protein BD414DRAFT_489801 [Trametes punicea]